MISPVVIALIETIASIEMADEASINLDFSVAIMEQLAHVLQALPDEDRREFIRATMELARGSPDRARASLILSIPESLGLNQAHPQK